MPALLRVLLPCITIILLWSGKTLEARPQAGAALKQRPHLQLVQSPVPLPPRRTAGGTDAAGQVPLPARRPVIAGESARPDVAERARPSVVEPAIVAATTPSPDAAPQAAPPEPAPSINMKPSVAWYACIGQVDILQRAARDLKIRGCTEVLGQTSAEAQSRRKDALK
jgi:hypothetical protein